ncbi:MAG: 2-iminoacetate synthase ThiH [Candidatus Hydrogenedentes bacterium]|nr:2-iminoacetate synthase ThiH [Candidatus Hydrogenedentota bacterium]
MSFNDVITQWDEVKLRGLFQSVTDADVRAALRKDDRSLRDLAALLSPAARPHLEAMAREAQRLTRWHFGRTIALYAPLYLSNLCAADCVYCGFSVRSENKEKRVTLKEPEIRNECEALAAQGFESVLLLTGEAPRAVDPDYIARGIAIAREYFASVSVEVYAVDQEDYRNYVAAGLEGVTLYMETYHRPTYAEVHLEGEKADYDYRLDAIERAGRAGVRKLSIGALLGLFDWRTEAFWTGLHGRYLQKHCWQSALAISFPRLLHHPDRFQIRDRVGNADLVQIILALRLFLPEAGFNLSTREAPELRDKLLPLGVTHMSAGSSTRPGGYATRGKEVLEQFEIEDFRSPSEIRDLIRSLGYDPVWKDYDRAFDTA